jgi:biopolymer transport protein ExbB
MIAMLATASFACKKSNASHSDTALASPDAMPEETTKAGEASVDASDRDGGARAGIGGGFPCDASEQCLTGVCNLGICSDWKHAMRIRIDTSATGAGVNETLTDFPLLVRLGGSANSFDFGQARTDGGDIRFVDDKGHNLSYQIERWDSGRRLAELWVSMPRIVGNSAANTILLYWGNEFAGPVASGAAIFDSYSCVYHIEDATLAEPGTMQVEDNSGHEAVGSIESPPSDAPASVNTHADGAIGYGLALDGKSSYLATPSIPQSPQSLSISLWFNAQLAPPGGLAAFYRPTLGMSDGVTNLAITMNANGTLSFSVSQKGTMLPITSPTSYDDHAWHFATARLSPSGQYLFVDGESVARNPALTSADSSQDSVWRFGQLPGVAAAGVPSAYFAGVLDEIRVSGNEESAAWIKLAYATQRPGSSAVTYLPAE